VGGHPDDPESGCGGTLARYTALGAGVTIVYLTRGEAGIPRKSHDEAAAIRAANWSGWLLAEEERLSGEKPGETAARPARETIHRIFGV